MACLIDVTCIDGRWRKFLQLAWSIHPPLVIQIAYRYSGLETVKLIVAGLVRKEPMLVADLVYYFVAVSIAVVGLGGK